MSVNEANPSEIDLFRQSITDLEAELEKKNVELEERRLSVDHLMKQINELRDAKGIHLAEIFDLKHRIEGLEKNRAGNDAENIKRDAENAELKVRVAKLEQDSSVVDDQHRITLDSVPQISDLGIDPDEFNGNWCVQKE